MRERGIFPPLGIVSAQRLSEALIGWREEWEKKAWAWLATSPTPEEIDELAARVAWCQQNLLQIGDETDGEFYAEWLPELVTMAEETQTAIEDATIAAAVRLDFYPSADLWDQRDQLRWGLAWRHLRRAALVAKRC